MALEEVTPNGERKAERGTWRGGLNAQTIVMSELSQKLNLRMP
jgi:hypothetical protein